jgi:hypothetical protein
MILQSLTTFSSSSLSVLCSSLNSTANCIPVVLTQCGHTHNGGGGGGDDEDGDEIQDSERRPI